MESTGDVLNNRTYEEYDPAVEWSHATDAETVTISLPGFKKDQLRVQVDRHGNLWARGERPVEAGSGKWVRFNKELKVPDSCDVGGIRSKLVNKTLTITLPKKSPPSPPDASAAAAAEPAPTVKQEEKKSDPSPPGGSALDPAPSAKQEEKQSDPSPPSSSASEPTPTTKQEVEKKKSPSSPDGSAPDEPAPAVQEEEKSRRPSPPEGSAPEPPALTMQEEEDEDEDEDEEETKTMVEIIEMDGRRPTNWLLVAMAAAFCVGTAAYVVWRKLRTGCAAGAGGHGPGEFAGAAGNYISEL